MEEELRKLSVMRLGSGLPPPGAMGGAVYNQYTTMPALNSPNRILRRAGRKVTHALLNVW